MATDWIRLISAEQAAIGRSSVRQMGLLGLGLTLLPLAGLLRDNGPRLTQLVQMGLLIGAPVLAVSAFLHKQYSDFELSEFSTSGLRVASRGRLQEFHWQQVDVRLDDRSGTIELRTPVRTLHLRRSNVGPAEYRALWAQIDRLRSHDVPNS